MPIPIIIVLVVLVVLIVGLMMSGYVKAPPDMAYIISGYRKDPKILIGRAGIKIPFLERKDNLIVLRSWWETSPRHWDRSMTVSETVLVLTLSP